MTWFYTAFALFSLAFGVFRGYTVSEQPMPPARRLIPQALAWMGLFTLLTLTLDPAIAVLIPAWPLGMACIALGRRIALRRTHQDTAHQDTAHQDSAEPHSGGVSAPPQR